MKYLPADLHSEHMEKLTPLITGLHEALDEASNAVLHKDGPLLMAMALRKADKIFTQFETLFATFSEHYQNLEMTNLSLWRQREELQDKYDGLKVVMDLEREKRERGEE